MEFSMFVVVFVAVYHVVDGCGYISLGADHTMCKYSGKACAITKREFSANDKAEIIKVHNEMRQTVANGKQSGQPSASNMKEVRWDDELATIAQRWADQCKFAHDTNRKTMKFKFVGQNVYISWSSEAISKVESRNAVLGWYNEVTNPGFQASNIKPFKFSGGTGHYTQVVWATTEVIGCGAVWYQDVINKMNTHMIVCNYGPGGNMREGSMYESGPACSKCLNGCSNTFAGLCK